MVMVKTTYVSPLFSLSTHILLSSLSFSLFLSLSHFFFSISIMTQVSDYSVAIVRAVMNSGLSIFSIVGFGFLTIINMMIFAFGLMFEALLFITTLFYLLASESGCIEVLNGIIIGRYVPVIHSPFTLSLPPLSLLCHPSSCPCPSYCSTIILSNKNNRGGDKLFQAFEKSIKAVFVSSIKMWLFHIVFTWLTFSIFLVDLVYINAFLAGLVAIMPFVVSVGNREEKARERMR